MRLAWAGLVWLAPAVWPQAACLRCHSDVWRSYQRSGMARSFSRPNPENISAASYDHSKSGIHYDVIERSGKFFARQYSLGKPDSSVETEIDYVIGSGNHARTYLHRTAAGKLIELPLGWYAEKG